MNVSLKETGKRYRNDWIFKGVDQDFKAGEKWLIKGSNGSGKSSFVKVFSGFTAATQGTISYHSKQYKDIHKNFAIAAPYLQLPESMKLGELIDFQKNFRPFTIKTENAHDVFNLPQSALDKKLGEFSSGMLQRVKLGLAVLSDVPVLILDEPVSNLDQKGVEWYQQLIDEHAKDKLVLVCSNEIKEEFAFCNCELNIEDYKTNK